MAIGLIWYVMIIDINGCEDCPCMASCCEYGDHCQILDQNVNEYTNQTNNKEYHPSCPLIKEPVALSLTKD